MAIRALGRGRFVLACVVAVAWPMWAAAAAPCEVLETSTATVLNAPGFSLGPGNDLAISADATVAVVADEEDGETAQSSGAVHLFARVGNHWVFQQKLKAFDAALGDRFGISAALSANGDTLMVGAYLDADLGTFSGSVYVYTRSGTVWVLQQKLHAPDGMADDKFGASVSLSANGNTALIGAVSDDFPGAANAGSAYVFVRAGTVWSFSAKVAAPVPHADDEFGNAVDLSADGTTAIVGCNRDDQTGMQGGAAFVFRRVGNAWNQETKLLPDMAATLFGFSVALSADGMTAVVGAPLDEPAPGSVGAVYLFGRVGGVWAKQGKFVDTGVDFENPLGGSVDISDDGNTAVAARVAVVGVGHVYRRSGATWQESMKLMPSNPGTINFFGNKAAISGNGQIAIIQAGVSINAMIGYFHDLTPCPVAGDVNGDGLLNSIDAPALAAVLIGLPQQPADVGRADLNHDGVLNGADVGAFVSALLGG